MASFYAELQLEGRAYPVRLAEFFLRQATDARGRVIGKVRQGPLRLTLDVPDHDATFEHWAATAYLPLAGQVVFYNMTAQVPHETIAFAAGQCVGYLEDFDDGRGNTGPAAYICHLTITAPAFELLAGGPAVPLAPAAARRWAERATETPTPGLSSSSESALINENTVSDSPNYSTVSMDPDYAGEETGAVWGTKVKYLSAEERKEYELLIGKDGLIYDVKNNLFDTQGAGTVTGKGKAIFVMSDVGDIYASLEQQAGIFHHSSFLSGGPVASAGEIEVVNGLVKTVSNRSGHYTPEQSYTHQLVEQLWRKGAKDTDAIKVVDFEH